MGTSQNKQQITELKKEKAQHVFAVHLVENRGEVPTSCLILTPLSDRSCTVRCVPSVRHRPVRESQLQRICHCPHLPPPLTGGKHRFLFTGLRETSMSCDVFLWSRYTGCVSISAGAEHFPMKSAHRLKEPLHAFLGLSTGWSLKQ